MGSRFSGAIGAARLAMTALLGGGPLDILTVEPQPERLVEPEGDLAALLEERLARYDRVHTLAIAECRNV